MARRTFEFDQPDRFVAGALGQPGQRVFFLQARQGRRTVSVVLEKVQVAALADRLGRLILDLEANEVIETAEGAGAGSPLEMPIEPVFRAGTLSFGWDGERETFVVEAHAASDDDDEDDEDAGAVEAIDDDAAEDDDDAPDVFRVRVTAAAARAFVEGANRVVRAGRPPCPVCGNPLDPGGHICPRRNGTYVH